MGSLWAGIPRTPATPGQGWTGCASRPLLGGGAVWGIVWPRFPVWAPPLPPAWTESSAGASSSTEGPSPGLWQACSWKPTGPGGAGQLSAAKKPQCLTIRPAPHSPLLVTWCFLFRVEDRPAELREAGEPAQATWPVAAPHSAGLLLPSCALGPLRPHWPRPSPLVDRTEVRAPAWRPRYDKCLPPSRAQGQRRWLERPEKGTRRGEPLARAGAVWGRIPGIVLVAVFFKVPGLYLPPHPDPPG